MIGPIIKAARKARRLTLAEVGDTLGVTRQYVHAWEAGRRNPGPKHLAKLADVLGLDVLELLPSPRAAQGLSRPCVVFEHCAGAFLCPTHKLSLCVRR